MEQSELSLIGLLKSPEMLRDDIVRTFGDEEETAVSFAIRWAWDHRRIKCMSQAKGAEHIGVSASHFSNILSGQKYLPPHKINAYEWLVGNKAISQTIERFRARREQEQTRQLAELIAQNMVQGVKAA